MATDEASRKLERLKEKIRKSAERCSGIDEDAIETEDGRVLGPRNDLEKQRRRREVREPDDE